jgi:phage-related holin
MTTELLKGLVVTAWLWLWSMILPVGQFMAFTMLLVLCDFITGVAAARHRKEELRSRGFMRSVYKIALYCIAILLSHGMTMVFFAPKGISFDLVWVVAGLIGLTEFKSNLENVATVTGVDAWARVAEVIPQLFKLPKVKTKDDQDDAT